MKFTIMRQVKDSVERQNQLRLDGKLCDVTLCCGGVKFQCHKVVLASASDYFNAMFTRGMVECCKPEIPVNDIEPEVLKIILDFIYTAELVITENTICRLMPAATMLQMSHVTEACATFLEHQLDPSNCIGIGRFAQQYGCIDLQKRAERYVLKHFSEVSELSEEFPDLTFDELHKIISSTLLIAKCETEVYSAVFHWVAKDVCSRKEYLPALLEKVKLPNLPPDFIDKQLKHCHILKAAPADCLEKLKKLFDNMQTHCQLPNIPPRPACEKQAIYCIGGLLNCSVSAVEVYDSCKKEWRRIPDVPHPRSGLAACTVLGLIYAVGGRNNRDDLNLLDCYDPKVNEWKSMPSMSCRRYRVCAAVLDNKLFAIGGCCGVEAHSSVEYYDPGMNRWFSVASMSAKRSAAGAAVVNRFLYVVGGCDGSTRLSTMEKYHPELNEWLPCPPMSVPRSGAGVASLGTFVYVAGGYDANSQLNSVERFNTVTGTWETVAHMRNTRSALNMVSYCDKLFVLGGFGGHGFVSSVECYDPATNTWTEVASMPSGKSGQGATLGPCPLVLT